MRAFIPIHRIVVVVMVALLAPCIFSASVSAADETTYSMLRVFLDSPGADAVLRSNPNLDIVLLKKGSYVEIVAQAVDLEWLDRSGLRYDIVHEDLEAYYASRSRGANFGLFHTFSEATDWLDQMHADYPDVVSARWSLGQSHEGRDIWCVRVSDNPETDETDEPEILFDGLHHAREVMSSEMVLMLIDYFGSNYGVDEEITWLLNNREVYLVPIVNPDGFVYNETISPDGGGMWRKNRRDNGDDIFGVDPNRNYPFEWGDPGSSADPASGAYRGPSPGSEPEVQALMSLANDHAFVTSQSFHTFSNLTIFPWGYTPDPSPDDAIFEHMATIMTRYNGYQKGQAPELLYLVNGSTPDWLYGETSQHPACFAFLNEIGGYSDGFWPDESRRDVLFNDNLWPSLYQIMCAGSYVKAQYPAVVNGDGNGYLDPGETAGLSFDLENMGILDNASDVQITLKCDDPYLQLHEVSRSVGTIAARSLVDFADAPFSATLDPVCPDGRSISVAVVVSWDDGCVTQILQYRVGVPVVVFFENFESGLDRWTTTGEWDLTTAVRHSPSNSLTDTPSGDYSDDSLTSATMNEGVSLPGGGALSFWHRFDIELYWDFGYVQVSVDGGLWTTVATYDGIESYWKLQEIDLTPYAGDSVRIRFELFTDFMNTCDGWYIDDVKILGGGSLNQLPSPPPLIAPLDDATTTLEPALDVGDSFDPDMGDPVTYGFRVYSDEDCTTVAAAADGVPQGMDGHTIWTVSPSLISGDTYWWRAYAADSEARGLLGETRSFNASASAGVGLVLPDLGLRRLGGTGGGTVCLALDLPRGGDLDVTVYNARGQAVRTLVTGTRDAGIHLLSWDGLDMTGRQSASGVYFVRVRAAGETATAKVLLVR